jgi:hypothetical protein
LFFFPPKQVSSRRPQQLANKHQLPGNVLSHCPSEGQTSRMGPLSLSFWLRA